MKRRYRRIFATRHHLPMTGKPKTVLIVDDDEGMRDTLTAILKRDYNVLTVSSGEAALVLLKQEEVDLVVRAGRRRTCGPGWPPARRGAATRRSSRSTWPRFRTSWSRARCSATSAGRSR